TESAAGQAQLEHEVERVASNLREARIARELPRLEVIDREQRLIGEHLLEVRLAPRRIDGVAMEAAADGVMNRRLGHLAQRAQRELGFRAEKEIDARRLWKSRTTRLLLRANLFDGTSDGLLRFDIRSRLR